MNSRLDKFDTFGFSVIVIFFKFFPMGSHIHVKDSFLNISFNMFSSDHGLLNSIHTADTRAVGVIIAIDVTGADALEPAYLLRFTLIRTPSKMTHTGS